VQQEGGGWNLVVGESWRLSHHSNLLCWASVCRGAGAVQQHRRCWEVQYDALNPVELGEEAHQNVRQILYQSYVNTLPLLYYFSNTYNSCNISFIMLDFCFCVLHFVDERGMMNIQINTHFASQPSAQNQAIKFNSINITAI
jgi:hypothetical protein